MIIAGSSEYSFDELNTLSQTFTGFFDVETREYEEFSEVAVGALLIFTLQGVTSGFLQAMGDKIWLDFCEIIAGFTANKRTGKADEVEFRVTPTEAYCRVSSVNKEITKEALKQFPKALEWAEKNRRGDNVFLEFDGNERKWRNE